MMMSWLGFSAYSATYEVDKSAAVNLADLSTGDKVVKRATSAATRTVTSELSRSILGNLIK